MKKIILLQILILFISNGCKKDDKKVYSDVNKESKFKIEGSIINGTGKKFYFEKIRPDSREIIDSVIIDKNGKFQITSTLNYPGLYLLLAESGPSVVLCLKGGEKINIEADYNNLAYYSISGSDESEQIRMLTLRTKESMNLIGQLSRISRDSINSPNYPEIKMKINEDFLSIVNDLRSYSINFLKNNQTSLASLVALKNEIGPNMHVLHPSNDKNLFLYVDSVLMSIYPKSELVLNLHNELTTYIALHEAEQPIFAGLPTGESAPDIELPSPSGEIIKLSSLRGKIVLLDFWAAWCHPCRIENPNLVNAYQKYHSKGFEIFQVSLDREKEAWLNAIKDDNLTWFHVSDLKYWGSQVVSLYRINGIPANYLLNREGKIVAKNLRGSALIDKLEEIFHQ